MTDLMLKHSLEIQARPERVWQVLTDPDFTQKYMFGSRAVSDWKVGSPLGWESETDGKKILQVTGTIVEQCAPHLLHYTVFDPNGGYRDTPDNYLHVTYALTPVPGGVRLEVTQGDFATVENGQKRYQDSVGGWEMVLPQIKALAESK